VDAVAPSRPSGEQFISSICQKYVTVTDSALSGSYLHGLQCEFLRHYNDRTICCSSLLCANRTGYFDNNRLSVAVVLMIVIRYDIQIFC